MPVFSNGTDFTGYAYSPFVENINNFYISCAWWVGSALLLLGLGSAYIAAVPT